MSFNKKDSLSPFSKVESVSLPKPGLGAGSTGEELEKQMKEKYELSCLRVGGTYYIR